MSIGIFHTTGLNLYLNLNKTSQCFKYTALELDCANYDLVCFKLTTIFIATVSFLETKNVCFVWTQKKTKNTCCSLVPCKLTFEWNLMIRLKNATTTSLLNVLAWKNKTNMLRLAKIVFNAMKRRKEFTGSS